MRTSFGRKAMKLRAARGISQTEFAQLIGESVSRVSQIEHGRVSVTDAVVSKYIMGLDCSGKDAHDLRQLAAYSNSKTEAQKSGIENGDLAARITVFDERIRPETARKIKELLDRDLGEIAPHLLLNNVAAKNKDERRNGRNSRKRGIPSLTPASFARLCVLSEEIRSKFCGELQRLDVIRFLESYCVSSPTLDIDVLEALPAYADGAYACIVGTKHGNVILVEERRFLAAQRFVFFRHALMHEFSHHILHPELLETTTECYLPPSPMAKLSEEDLTKSTRESGNFEQVDTLTEVEAETLATLLLVPWTQLVRATETRYLYRDFGEEERHINRLRSYLRQPAVINAIKGELWKRGYKEHPFFDYE